MYDKTMKLKSRPAGQPAGLLARAGRSLCRRRPVSMPASAGLYAGVGRSLCRYGPQGPWAQPLFDCVAELFLFSGILGAPKNKNVCCLEKWVYCF